MRKSIREWINRRVGRSSLQLKSPRVGGRTRVTLGARGQRTPPSKWPVALGKPLL